MLDFTSALYLGMRHPSRSLRPWSQFTTGVPAALSSPPDSGSVAHELAVLQGCEGGVLGTSTLHQFWDLFGIFARQRVAIHVDAGAYPIARWGVERAAALGVPVREFAHHNLEALEQGLRRDARKNLVPLLVTDGFCTGCGRPGPLGAYLDRARAHGGWLIIDDTQALGIFGHSPTPAAPYGQGGGGMLVRNRIGGPDVLVVSSLAKAFGVPLAVLSGSKSAIKVFEAKSETRMHCSPPSVATVRAAEHALMLNRLYGDSLRSRLSSLVRRFRQQAAHAGLHFSGGLFPFQTLLPSASFDMVSLHEQLLKQGIQTVLHQARNGHGPRVSFLITARHAPEELDRSVIALSRARARQRPPVHLEAKAQERRAYV
jgi:8-amino-7-oxononanoate synthase